MIGPDFEHLCRLVRERSGLVLGPDKTYLLKARLEPIARAEKLESVERLLEAVRRRPSEALIERCVEALATHESSFFRDGAPFEVLKADILPALIAARAGVRRLRIWCAACSSGQEPYSVAMVLKELGHLLAGWRVEILATDFSAPILRKAEAGLYSEFEVRRGLSPDRLARWFRADGAGWRVVEPVQQMVRFQRHNLLSGSAQLGVFDVIFCRNVLIYLDGVRKQEVLTSLSDALAVDGALFLGAAESLVGLPSSLAPANAARGLCRRVQHHAKIA